MECGVEGHSGVAGGDSAQVAGHPARMVVGKEGDACARGQLFLGQPAADRLGHLASLGVGIAFDLVVALDFEGNVLRAALRGFDKLVVKSGHEGRGKYT